jgi:hypothetical protein
MNPSVAQGALLCLDVRNTGALEGRYVPITVISSRAGARTATLTRALVTALVVAAAAAGRGAGAGCTHAAHLHH